MLNEGIFEFLKSGPRTVKLSRKEMVIVELLINKRVEMTGYELAKASAGGLSLAGIYVYLNRLEKKGVVRSRYEVVAGGTARLPKRYITLMCGTIQETDGRTKVGLQDVSSRDGETTTGNIKLSLSCQEDGLS